MSPWPRERILAWLCPRAVVIARQSVGLGCARIIEHRERELSEVHAARAGLACVDVLETMLENCGWRRARLSVCISDHFVRYAVLPWRAGLRARADWEAYAKHEFEARYQCERPIEMRIAHTAADTNQLAAAIDTEVLQRLHDMAAARDLSVVTMEPNACRVANRFRRKLGRRGHLLVAEADRVTWLSFSEDRWTDIRSVRNDDGLGLIALVLHARMHSAYEAEKDEVWAWGVLNDDAIAKARLGSVSRLQAPDAMPRSCSALGLV